jgi:anti-anti-sigma factor
MKIQYTVHENGPSIINVNGPIETTNAGEFKSTVDHLLSKGKPVILLDAQLIDFVSSEGIHALIQTHLKLKSLGGFLLIVAPNSELVSLFKAISIFPEFSFAGSMDEAVKISEKAGMGSFDTVTPAAIMDRKDYEEPQYVNLEIPVIAEQPVIPEGESVFDKPFVIECEECNAYVRVHSSGQFMCPSCHAEFTVSSDGTVVF